MSDMDQLLMAELKCCDQQVILCLAEYGERALFILKKKGTKMENQMISESWHLIQLMLMVMSGQLYLKLVL